MKEKCVIWGAGSYFLGNFWRIRDEIEIDYIVDSDAGKQGKLFFGTYECFSVDKVFEENYGGLVVVAVSNEYIAQKIYDKLKEQNIRYIPLCDVIKRYTRKKEYEQIVNYDKTYEQEPEPGEIDKIVRFFSVSVPEKGCNLNCPYCYITQAGGYKVHDAALVSPEFFRRAISRKRVGGTALVNFCGAGETLLCKELYDIVQAILEEGHYVSIVTNALLSKELNRYIMLSEEMRERLFFKCSFHYSQLIKLNLLEQYAENVKRLRNAGISISVELVPEDSIESNIDEIMEFCTKEFGALPHITVARDESQDAIPIATQHTEKDYYAIWSRFDSDMFRFKMRNRARRREYCFAGERTLLFSLENGLATSCPYGSQIDNVFEDISKPIRFCAVGTGCCIEWCINGHAYLTLGMIKEVNESSYLEIRDRTCNNQWGNWVTPKMAKIMSQRICDNIV